MYSSSMIVLENLNFYDNIFGIFFIKLLFYMLLNKVTYLFELWQNENITISFLNISRNTINMIGFFTFNAYINFENIEISNQVRENVDSYSNLFSI